MKSGTAASRRFYRSREDRVAGGVAGGLAHAFDLDPTLARLAFVVLAFAGFGVLAYLLLWIVLPERPEGEPEPAITATLTAGRGRQLAGYGLLILGALLLAADLGWLDAYWARLVWPLLLVAAGVVLLITRGPGAGTGTDAR